MENIKPFFTKAKFYTPYLGVLYFIIGFPLYLVYGLYLDNGLLQTLVFYSLIFISVFMVSLLVLKNKSLLSFLFIFFMVVNFIQIYFSDYANISDLGYVIRTLGVFSAGCFFYTYIRNNELNKIFYLIFYVVLYIFVFNFNYKEGQYLQYSDSFVILSFLLISIFFKNKKFSTIIFLFSIFGLLLINSRSAILFFFFSYLCLYFYINGFKKSILWVFILFSSAFYLLVNLSSNSDNFKDYRILVLLFDTSSDTSLNARLSVNDFGIEVFKKNPILGDFGVYRLYLGDGLYAHNFISFLAEFGLFGLFFIFYFLFIFGLSIMVLLKKRKKNFLYSDCFLLVCTIYALLGIFLSKSYVWLFFYFTLGMAVSFLNCYFKNGNKVSL